MSRAKPKTGGTDSTAASDVRQTGASGTGSPQDETHRDDDELFDILANQRRRFVLHYLRQHPDECVSLSTLSEHVAGWEHDAEPTELDYRERKSVRNSLHQFHLPKLDDTGIVEYDDRSSEISLVDAAGADAYHAVVDDESVPWAAYGLGATAGGLAVYALAFFGVLAALPAVVWAALFVGAFLVATTLAASGGRDRRRTADCAPPECNDTERTD